MFSENSNSTKKFSFTLERSDFKKSIFCGVNSYEVVNPEMCNGFIVNKMGIKFHKTGKFKNMPYKNEQELFISYQKITSATAIKSKLSILWRATDGVGCNPSVRCLCLCFTDPRDILFVLTITLTTIWSIASPPSLTRFVCNMALQIISLWLIARARKNGDIRWQNSTI